MMDVRNQTLLCQPGVDGRPIFPDDPALPIPNINDPAVWPYRTHLTTQFCIDIFSFIDIRPVLQLFGLKTFPYEHPTAYVSLLSPEGTVRFNQWKKLHFDQPLFVENCRSHANSRPVSLFFHASHLPLCCLFCVLSQIRLWPTSRSCRSRTMKTSR